MKKNIFPVFSKRLDPALVKRFEKAVLIKSAIEGQRVYSQDALADAITAFCVVWEKKVKAWKPGKM